jgi:hypothetical protein
MQGARVSDLTQAPDYADRRTAGARASLGDCPSLSPRRHAFTRSCANAKEHSRILKMDGCRPWARLRSSPARWRQQN